MTQEDKKLLIRDLCARLPHGVKGRVYTETTNGEYDINGDMIFFDSPFDVVLDDINTSTEELHVVAIGNEDTIDFIEDQQTYGAPYTIDDFKPYLRPIDSMTEKEREQLYSAIEFYGKIDKDGDIDASEHEFVFSETCAEYIEWLIENHFDYNDLIGKDLALEAPKDMYKEE